MTLKTKIFWQLFRLWFNLLFWIMFNLTFYTIIILNAQYHFIIIIVIFHLSIFAIVTAHSFITVQSIWPVARFSLHSDLHVDQPKVSTKCSADQEAIFVCLNIVTTADKTVAVGTTSHGCVLFVYKPLRNSCAVNSLLSQTLFLPKKFQRPLKRTMKTCLIENL